MERVTRTDHTQAFHRFSLIACARGEAPYIREWVSYHLSIGFNHIYLYCNDSVPDECYEEVLPFTLGANPFLTFFHYPYAGLQMQMYMHYVRNHSANTQWMMFLDIDEFLFTSPHNNIERFIAAFDPAVDAVYFNWLAFGHNGHRTRPQGSVLRNYTSREAHVTPFTKVLIRSDKLPYAAFVERPGHPIHHDYQLIDSSLNIANVFGENIDSYYNEFPHYGWVSINHENRKYRMVDVGFVAHYNIKSEDDFSIRIQRGLFGDFAGQKAYALLTDAQKKEIYERINAVTDCRLSAYWKKYVSNGQKRTVFAVPSGLLLSADKPATQSSTAHMRSVDEDAAKLVDGDHSAQSHNHTELEADPWWRVDLGLIAQVAEVRLFNRIEQVERMRAFSVELSVDDERWDIAFKKTDDSYFGGVETFPYIATLTPTLARYVRISVPGLAYLHLRQVEVFGALISGSDVR